MSLPPWTEGAWFLASLGLLALLQAWLHRSVQAVLLLATWNSRAAFLLYVALLLPGVAFHELSHWLAAKLLGIRVRALSLRPRRQSGGRVRFGYVTTDRSDAVRSALVGLAPTLMGCGALLLAVNVSGLFPEAAQAWDAGDTAAILVQAKNLLSTPAAAAWLYLALVIGNNMLPSPEDRASWLAAGLLVGGFLVAFALVGAVGWIERWGLPAARWAIRGLSAAFGLVAALDLLLLAVLWSLRKLLEGLTGRIVVERGR